MDFNTALGIAKLIRDIGDTVIMEWCVKSANEYFEQTPYLWEESDGDVRLIQVDEFGNVVESFLIEQPPP